MTNDKIVTKILSYPWPSQEELVEFAVRRHGFGGDDGFYGITYPGDIDDYDRANGRTIPKGMVGLSYWDGEIKETLIAEKDYLGLLTLYLEKQGASQLALEIHNFIKKYLHQNME